MRTYDAWFPRYALGNRLMFFCRVFSPTVGRGSSTLSTFLDRRTERVKLAKFRGKAPGPDTIHNEVLRVGTTTSLFHHLARLFTSSIQLGYIPTAWKIATLHMLLKPDKLPSLTTSYRPISLISSIMKLFERVIEQRLRSYLEHIGFINKHQSGFRKA